MATITILSPAHGATVVQPVTATGTVAPGASSVTACCKGADGQIRQSTPATEFGPTWSFFFAEVPTGAATITVSLADGTSPQSVNCTVISPP